MAQDKELGLALGLSLASGGGGGHHEHELVTTRSEPPPLSLTLSLPSDSGLTTPPPSVRTTQVKRELQQHGEEDEYYDGGERALYSVASSVAAADDDDGCNSRKKLRLSKDQSALLEDRFKEHSTLNPKQKVALAKQLNLRPRQVEVWFQNRRARTKLKQTEVDCELLKRCCETLTEENRRLHRELQQLRALSHPHAATTAGFFMAPLPAATLTICPSCELLAGDAAPADRTKKSAHFFGPFAKSAAC
uniref:Homeobox domain-containing protein n=1 Tax=Leersia perrieri TaxID=77586 RepID=A0A0D9XH74_9ORYZ